MHSPLRVNDVSNLHALQDDSHDLPGRPADPALQHLREAWNALEDLEASLPEGPDRWQGDHPFSAREGIQRAWLAVSNLGRGLKSQEAVPGTGA